MSQTVTIIIDGRAIGARQGQTLLEAADAAGVYIPRLCYHPELVPGGHCRLCTVRVNGKHTNACIMTVFDGMVVDNETEELTAERRSVLEMLFVEGNHYCPFCELSGNCELQALAYRLGMEAPQLPYQLPHIEVDATHPDVYIDRNRCVLCSRCVRASRDLDEKGVFAFEGRGMATRVAVNAPHNLGETDLEAIDRAADICPTGSIVRKRVGFRDPVGERRYDKQPIGADIERRERDEHN